MAGSTPAPASPPASLDELWQRLLDSIGDVPAMTWIRALEPKRIEGDRLELVTLPGQRNMLGFITDARRKRLSEMIESIAGRRLRIELSAPVADDAPAQQPAGRQVSQDQRRKAMDLPLVREVIDLFEASLTDVRPETNPEPQTPQDTDDHV